jgi:DNA-binding response OmpR family regulator
VQYKDLVIDLNSKRVMLNGRDIVLTTTEYYIIAYLAANVGRVITFDQLLEKVWGDACIDDDNHILQVNISRLRDKLGDNVREPKFIKAMRGIGYMMLKPEPDMTDH